MSAEKTDDITVKARLDDLYRYKEKYKDNFDKYNLLTSSGVLGISFAFIEKIVKVESAKCTWMLTEGWSYLAMSIFGSLIMYFIFGNSANAVIQAYNSGNESKRKLLVNFHNGAISLVRIVLIILNIMGTYCIIRFVEANI